jgi:hypothetical protein
VPPAGNGVYADGKPVAGALGCSVLGSSSSSAKWAGKNDVLYSIDYQRGIDILRYRGEHYVPGEPESGNIPGTNGETPPIAPNAAQAAQRAALAQRLAADGWSPGLCYLSAQRI